LTSSWLHLLKSWSLLKSRGGSLRQLGIAARFVSGYLYDASLDDDVGPAASGMTKLPS
jgi:hypothetical protein